MAEPILLLLPTKFARERIDERGLNEGQIKYAIQHHEDEYPVGKYMVYKSTLPDGKSIKVRIEELFAGSHGGAQMRVVRVIDAFTYK